MTTTSVMPSPIHQPFDLDAWSGLRLAQVEQAASALLYVPVDLVLDDAIRPDLRDRILNEAVPL